MSDHQLRFKGPGFDFDARGWMGILAAIVIAAMVVWLFALGTPEHNDVRRWLCRLTSIKIPEQYGGPLCGRAPNSAPISLDQLLSCSRADQEPSRKPE